MQFKHTLHAHFSSTSTKAGMAQRRGDMGSLNNSVGAVGTPRFTMRVLSTKYSLLKHHVNFILKLTMYLACARHSHKCQLNLTGGGKNVSGKYGGEEKRHICRYPPAFCIYLLRRRQSASEESNSPKFKGCHCHLLIVQT